MATQKVGKISITHKRAREMFNYDPDTGIVSWKKVPKPNRHGVKVGDKAGYVTKNRRRNYRRVCIDSNEFSEHRFIWFWMTGRSAPLEIDHKDRNPLNNKWDNLRLATNFEQQANKIYAKKNKNGYKGVARKLQASGLVKYQATICKDGTSHYLGLFPTAKAAHQKYVKEAKRLHGEFYLSS